MKSSLVGSVCVPSVEEHAECAEEERRSGKEKGIVGGETECCDDRREETVDGTSNVCQRQNAHQEVGLNIGDCHLEAFPSTNRLFSITSFDFKSVSSIVTLKLGELPVPRCYTSKRRSRCVSNAHQVLIRHTSEAYSEVDWVAEYRR